MGHHHGHGRPGSSTQTQPRGTPRDAVHGRPSSTSQKPHGTPQRIGGAPPQRSIIDRGERRGPSARLPEGRSPTGSRIANSNADASATPRSGVNHKLTAASRAQVRSLGRDDTRVGFGVVRSFERQVGSPDARPPVDTEAPFSQSERGEPGDAAERSGRPGRPRDDEADRPKRADIDTGYDRAADDASGIVETVDEPADRQRPIGVADDVDDAARERPASRDTDGERIQGSDVNQSGGSGSRGA